MIEGTSFFEQCQEECRELAHKWHSLGLTVVIAYHSDDPREDESQTSYTTAGTYMSCVGLSTWLHSALLNPTDDEE